MRIFIQSRRWTRFIGLAMAFMLVGAVAFAGGAQEAQDTEEPGQDLIILVQSDVVSLDPHGSNDSPSSNVRTKIYDNLIYFNEDMELQAGLATDWELIDDTTWEFTLREGVTFHDGTEFTAEAVKANLDRIVDPELASQRAFLFTMLDEVEVVDDYTVRISTEFPFVPILSHLAHDAAGIASPAALEEAGYDETEAVGTGPYKLQSWEPGDELVLERNEDFWGPAPNPDTVTFRVVPEESTRMALVERGDAHVAEILQPATMGRVEASNNMELELFDTLSLNYIGFNTEKEPFDDARVRRAITMAINIQEMIDGIVEGAGTRAVGPISEAVVGFHPDLDPLPYDQEMAAELLADAGYEDGFSTTLWTNDNPTRIAIAEIVQNNLAELNIDVEIEVLEWGAYLDQTAEGLHDMFILGWVTVTGDADYGMYALLHSSNVGAAGNRAFYENDEVDDYLDRGRQEADPEDRVELYQEVQEILIEDAPMVNLYHPQWMIAVASNVSGYSHHPDNAMLIDDVVIE
ncbi:MAG: glutathione ABC transporter substrate-binding protein [Alkalispirochaeta sp.]